MLTRISHGNGLAAERGPAPGQTAFELLGRVDQQGFDFVVYGYLTFVHGLPYAAIFSNPAQTSEATARLTFSGSASAVARTQLRNVIVIDAVGSLTVYANDTPGASFDDPASFTDGTPAARFDLRIQNVLNVIAPNQGLSSLWADLTQTHARSFPVDGARHQLGKVGLRGRLEAIGQGTRLEPTTPVVELDLAGSVVYLGSAQSTR
jgi:hypothetical protein